MSEPPIRTIPGLRVDRGYTAGDARLAQRTGGEIIEVEKGSSDLIDIDAIRRPISKENPVGKNLRADPSPVSSYYRLKEARNAARLAERKAESGEQVASDWRTILEQASKALVGESKDLEVAAWLTEALCRLHGFSGLAQGFMATRVLVEGFWDGLWPRPDDEGLLTRLAPLTGLNGEDGAGTLIAPITSIPISQGSNGEVLATWTYQKALEISRIADAERRERAAAAPGTVTLEAFQRSVATTQPRFFAELVEGLQASIDEFDQLGAALDRVCGADAPPSSNIRNALQEVLAIVRSLAKDKLTISGDALGASAANSGPSAPPAVSASAAIQSREAAFQSLVRVADFFRQTEPHSPLSYMLEQAVRWGRLPLPELLDELIPNESSRTEFMKLVGIRAAKKE